MKYFSYNDYMDYTENGEINEVKRVEENIAKYELKNGAKTKYNSKNRIIKMFINMSVRSIFFQIPFIVIIIILHYTRKFCNCYVCILTLKNNAVQKILANRVMYS